ncbi:MAG: DEAD/DEAH box helicase [Verrucomicrobia bacterium]|nr:DEAD/DEAH box helicase [Verrucomicrobiota bacterium]
MKEWTESTLRGAASWQAFKAGKSLGEAGAATVAKVDASGWQGTVREGQRLLRVSVRVKSATDFDTRCGCPENQSSGAMCAHAVAVGLAALRGPEPQPGHAQACAAPPPQAWDIHFPPNWREALARGKLAATLSRGIEPTPADHALTSWLAVVGGAERSPLHLQLAGATLAAFLDAGSGHPRITHGKERAALEIRSAGKITLRELTRHNGSLRLVPAPASHLRIGITGCLWQLETDALIRLGSGEMPADLAGPLAELLAGRTVELPCDEFLARLEIWQEWLDFPPESWLEDLHFVAAPFTVGLSLEGSLQHLEARLTIHYPGAAPVPPGCATVPGFPRLTDAQHCEVRDLEAEHHATTTLARAGFEAAEPAAGRWLLRGENTIVRFLTHTLPDLRRDWGVTEGEHFRKVRHQVVLVEPKIEILGSGEDWLSFNLSFQASDGAVVSAAEVRRLLRSGGGQGTGANARRLIVSSEVSEVIEPLFSELDLRQEGGHYTASARAGELVYEIREKLDKSLSSNGRSQVVEFPQPAAIRAELRPYQNRGAAWLWDRVQRFGGALLADDMGLGKTLQAIVLIERVFESIGLRGEAVVLVVATTSLLGNWRAELARFAPGRRVRILHGVGRDAEREQVADGEVILTSYSTLARDLAWHLRRDYCLVVVDEASLMRNPDTDHAKALVKLRATRRIALTGTPVENGVRDLWSIFRFILPGWLGGREEFRERYEIPLGGGESVPPLLERLRLKTAPFLLRRTKEQVAPELPSKLHIDEFCDLSSEQQAVYRELLQTGRKQVEALQETGNPGAARMQMLTALLRLRQTCCDLALFGSERFKRMPVSQRSAKLQRLLELLEEAVAGNHKVLVFSQFQTQLREIEKCLREREWGSLRLDGQTRNRQEMVEYFQAPGGPPVFLISLKAGGYGLNLTAADIVIHFDPWWNPAAEAQATDRAHRIGQTRPVTVYRLLTRGTVEEKVLRLQSRKRALSAAIDESGCGEAPGWSETDLRAVMEDAGD